MRENRTSGSIGGRWPEDPGRKHEKTTKPRPSVTMLPTQTSNQRPTSLVFGFHHPREANVADRAVTADTAADPR